MHRLFVAIEFGDDVKSQLLDLRENLYGFRWMTEDQLHLTLRFIGNVDNETLVMISEKLKEIHIPDFSLSIKGVGVFPDKHRAKIIWAGVNSGDILFDLQRQIERLIVECGMEPDYRKFTPHITLARLRNIKFRELKGFLDERKFLHIGPIKIDRFYLVSSKLGEKGSIYSNIAKYPLGQDEKNQ